MFRRKSKPKQSGVTLNELMISIDPYLRIGQGSGTLRINVTEHGPFITLYEADGDKAIQFEDPDASADRAARVDEVATAHTGRRVEPGDAKGLHYVFVEPDGLRRFLDELLWTDYERTTIYSLTKG